MTFPNGKKQAFFLAEMFPREHYTSESLVTYLPPSVANLKPLGIILWVKKSWVGYCLWKHEQVVYRCRNGRLVLFLYRFLKFN